MSDNPSKPVQDPIGTPAPKPAPVNISEPTPSVEKGDPFGALAPESDEKKDKNGTCRAAHARCDTREPACGRCSLLDVACIRGPVPSFRYSNWFVEASEVSEQGEKADGYPKTSTRRATRSATARSAPVVVRAVPHTPRDSRRRRRPRRRYGSTSEFRFSDDQTWVATQGKVAFVFERAPGRSPSVEDEDEDNNNDNNGYDDHGPLFLSSLGPEAGAVGLDPGPSDDPGPAVDILWLPGLHDDSGPGGCLPVSLPDDIAPLPLSLEMPLPPLPLALSPPPLAVPQPLPCWPLLEHEAVLLRYFVTDLSPWFDYGDPLHTFATRVPQCAVSSPPLLHAILAVSARHRSLRGRSATGTGPSSPAQQHLADLADSYHRTCLGLLIPLLDDPAAARDERLYAATVILRLYEEIMGHNRENHLMGTHTFVRLQADAPAPSAIRQAVFRVALRQEIVVSFRSQRPVQLLREYVRADALLRGGRRRERGFSSGSTPLEVTNEYDDEDDWTRAFHIFVLCAEVLTLCYGEGGGNRRDGHSLDDVSSQSSSSSSSPRHDWYSLAQRAKQWRASLPPSYAPLLYRPGTGTGDDPDDRDLDGADPDGPDSPDNHLNTSSPAPASSASPFPTIMLLNDCHVAARQHDLLVQILLAAHAPHRPQLGPRAAAATAATHAIVRRHVRALCGIALSNPHCVPAMFTACIAIAVCGDLFAAPREQCALLALLDQTDRTLAWPTAMIQARLREQWAEAAAAA